MDVLQHYRSSYIMERWTLSAIFPGLKKCWRLQTGKEKKNSIKVKGKHFGCIMRYIFFLLDKNPLMLLFTDYGHPDRKQPLQPKIQSQSQIFRYGQSIFCLPHRPNFSYVFDLCLHWVSVVHAIEYPQCSGMFFGFLSIFSSLSICVRGNWGLTILGYFLERFKDCPGKYPKMHTTDLIFRQGFRQLHTVSFD